MRRSPREILTLVVVSLPLAACSTWQHPKTALTPQEYVLTERPRAVLVRTTSGRRLRLFEAQVAGDSLVGPQGGWKTWPAAVARQDVAATRFVMESDGRYRLVELTMRDQRTLLLEKPVVTADSITGKVKTRHRPGVLLSEIAEIEVPRISAVATTGASLAGAAVLGLVIAVIAIGATYSGGL